MTETRKKLIERYISAILLVLAIIAIPVIVLSHGFRPVDDANRHTAFAMTDKTWPEVLILEDRFKADHNAGWHAVLRFLRREFNFGSRELMAFSVIALFIVVNLAGIYAASSPVCWFTALLVFTAIGGQFARMLFGRPYIVSCAAFLVLLKLWTPKEIDLKSPFLWLMSLFSCTMAVFIHGSWYIFLMLPIALFIAGRMKQALYLTLCIIVSTLAGALLTGNFFEFLYYHFAATSNIYGERVFNWQLVTENASGAFGSFWIVVFAVISSVLVYQKKLKLSDYAEDPVFIMLLLAWLPSILIIRFWVDWGSMTLLFWLSYAIHDLTKDMILLKKPFIRYFMFVFIVCSMLFITTNNKSKRYSSDYQNYTADFASETLKEWAPTGNGIIYSDNMGVFYNHFFAFPHKDWRYVLGFEAGTMQEENKRIDRNISYTNSSWWAYKPWIKKMTVHDRMILAKDLTRELSDLDWIRAARYCWVGKLKNAHE